MRRTLLLAAALWPIASVAQPDAAEALREAARRNDAATFRRLLAAGADVNAKDGQQDSAFLIACREGHAALVAAALAAGADIRSLNRYGSNAIFGASYRGHLDVVKLLLATPVDLHHVNNLGWTALLEAVVLGQDGPRHREIVQLLIQRGSDVDKPDREGVTALQHAQRRGHAQVASLLMAAPRRQR